MTERPILFNSKMVSAILEGYKTQTRRVIKPQNASKGSIPIFAYNCPLGKVGDRLYVREKFQLSKGDFAPTLEEELSKKSRVLYYASDNPRYRDKDKWKPSIHMPKWASRITLEITDIRVEQLQDISGEDCWKEGVDEEGDDYNRAEHYMIGGSQIEGGSPERYAFIGLWDSITKREYQWDRNPWVFVLTFQKTIEEEK
uniref:Uncharacterized protein n=1 Tax=viral metagenome TaxID=1070528 RepID=A0A6M3JVC1_9ZZZZ